MAVWPRLSLIIASLVLAGMSPNVFAHHDVNLELTSSSDNGQWFNDSIDINGSTTIPASNASWTLYDVTNPYAQWPILRSGNYFSTVTPVDDGLWIWTLSIDVQDLNCTCWLEISQPDGLYNEIINRIFFIGEGPHNPVISPDHAASFVVDEAVILTGHAYLAQGDFEDSMLLINWCNAPQGACVDQGNTKAVNLSWDNEVMTFTIDVNSFNLSDGIWLFNYSLRDAALRISPLVYIQVYVDQTDPIAVINALEESNESQMVTFDGSSSSDGIWTYLQYTWYITDPNGDFRAATTQSVQGAYFTLNESITTSGTWQIRLDVTDMVGRRDTTYANLTIHNVAPLAQISINQLDGEGVGNYQINQGDELVLDASNSVDSQIDIFDLKFSWYIDGTEISQNKTIDLSGLEPGLHQVELIVSDDDGLSSQLQLTITINEVAKPKESGFNMVGTISALVIIIVSLYFLQYKKAPGKVLNLPKWQKKSLEVVDEAPETDYDDSGIWVDSSNENQGKD